MLENQVLEPRILEVLERRAGVRSLTDALSRF